METRYFVKWTYEYHGQPGQRCSHPFASHTAASIYIEKCMRWLDKLDSVQVVSADVIPCEGEQYVVEPSEIGALLCAQDN